MKAVFKHEVSLYYHSLLAYVFGAFLLEFIGIGAMLYNINRAVANFEYALGTFCIAFVGLVPVLTMRVMAEEKKQKTDQLLSLLPITSTDIVLGKYFAAALVITYFAAPTALESLLPDLMKKLSPFERFYTFVNGVFDVTGIVYYISIAVFFLFLCVQSWEKKRYNG